jgi:hypothetical protein
MASLQPRVPIPYHKRVERLHRSSAIKLVDIQGYTYTVFGSTGKLYTITTDGGFQCNCIDCKRNKNYCKHIYFIFINVFGFTPDLDRTYTVEELHEFHDSFLKNRISKTARNENEDCPICFECNTSDCFVCNTCENGFHMSCIKTMLQFSNKCPLCRSQLNDVRALK